MSSGKRNSVTSPISDNVEGRNEGSRNGPNNGLDIGHYTRNDYGHIDSASTLVVDHNIPVMDQMNV